MKIKLDENMPADLATLLSEEGHNVRTVLQEGLSGKDDPRVLAAATSEGRLLMTFDTDFADIRRYPPGSHDGIVVYRLRDHRWTTLRTPAARLMANDNLERLAGALAIVTESRVRYRRGSRCADE